MEELMQSAGIEEGMRVLEPSAGKGDIADAMKDQGGVVDVVEMSSTLREILEKKGHNIVDHVFEEFEPSEQYDRIVMNPPFSNDLDIEHVRKAFTHLKPGGRLVAIVSGMAGRRSRASRGGTPARLPRRRPAVAPGGEVLRSFPAPRSYFSFGTCTRNQSTSERTLSPSPSVVK